MGPRDLRSDSPPLRRRRLLRRLRRYSSALLPDDGTDPDDDLESESRSAMDDELIDLPRLEWLACTTAGGPEGDLRRRRR